MKTIIPIALGLTLFMGLAAWRTRGWQEEAPFRRPSSSRPADPSPPPTVVHDEPRLGLFGSQSVTAKRLALWSSLEGIRSGGQSSEGDAVLFLEYLLKRGIAERAYGLRPSTAELEAMLRKLAADPEEADLLKRMEAFFHVNRQAFLDEVAAPLFIESELWARFRDDPAIHGAARASAEDIAAKARTNPREFLTIGSTDAIFGRGRVAFSQDAGVTSGGRPLPRLDSLPVDRAVLSQIPPGKIYPDVVVSSDGFVVIQVDRQRQGFTEVQTWTVPKVPYQTWLADRAREMNPTIDSPELRAQIDALDSNHWLSRVFRR